MRGLFQTSFSLLYDAGLLGGYYWENKSKQKSADKHNSFAGILFVKNIIMQIDVKSSDNTLDSYTNIYYNIKKNTAKEGMEMYRKVMEYLKS